MTSPGRRRGFSFIEVMIGVCILLFGLIPLLWALSSGTQQTRITLKQVQATNHAANLLEALRATPFQDLAEFPPCMAQLRGGDNQWRKPSEATDLEFILPEQVNAEPPKEAGRVFDTFKQSFFAGEVAIVPPLDSDFNRYFVVLRDKPEAPHYITLIVRVEWKTATVMTSDQTKPKDRQVELRTVVADPYYFGE